MSRRYSTRLFQKIVVPVIYGVDHGSALNAALAITERSNVLLIGIVSISESESLSTAALPARRLRKMLRDISREKHIRVAQRIRVSHKPWDEMVQIVTKKPLSFWFLACHILIRSALLQAKFSNIRPVTLS